MKQLLYLLFAITLFTSCSNDDDDLVTPQGQTSITVTVDTSNQLKNCIAAYKTKEGIYKKLGNLGNLTKGITSPEIKITDSSVNEVYIFGDLVGTIRFDVSYTLSKNVKNTIAIPQGTKGIPVTDKTDSTQYPQ